MNFPSALRRELPLWVTDGLVEQGQAEAIRQRYALDETREGTTGLLLPAIYLIGACLVGGGAISFVAAHWDSIPIPLRIALLLTTMLVCEIAGFILWKVTGTRERLGEALVALGAIVFGANVFLIAQMFHLHGPSHNAFGVWTLGVLAVAYATSSGPVMLLACLTSLVWSVGWTETHPHAFCWYPIAICMAAVPFLVRRSVLALSGVLFAAGVAASACAGADSGEDWAVLAMLVALGALSRGLGLWLRGSDGLQDLSLPALLLGGVAVLVPAYILSFHEPESDVVRYLWTSEGWLWTGLLGLVYIGAAVCWVAALRRTRSDGETRAKSLAMPTAAVVLTCGIAAGQDVVLAVTANLALLGIAASLLWNAVSLGRRREFWLGLLLLVLVVVSRFVEWDTHLMVKSVVFVLGGIAVILGGARFEKRLKGGTP